MAALCHECALAGDFEAPQQELALRLLEEDPEYLRRQLITYIGNKRALLG
jgi:hypothetical protein